MITHAYWDAATDRMMDQHEEEAVAMFPPRGPEIAAPARIRHILFFDKTTKKIFAHQEVSEDLHDADMVEHEHGKEEHPVGCRILKCTEFAPPKVGGELAPDLSIDDVDDDGKITKGKYAKDSNPTPHEKESIK